MDYLQTSKGNNFLYLMVLFFVLLFILLAKYGEVCFKTVVPTCSSVMNEMWKWAPNHHASSTSAWFVKNS